MRPPHSADSPFKLCPEPGFRDRTLMATGKPPSASPSEGILSLRKSDFKRNPKLRAERVGHGRSGPATGGAGRPRAERAGHELVAVEPDGVGSFDRGLVLERLDRRAEAAQAFQTFIARWKGDPTRARAAEDHLRRLEGKGGSS